MAVCPQGFLDALKREGLLPDLATRCVIDITHDDVVRIYWQTIADDRWLRVLTGERLGDVVIERIDGQN